MQNNLFRWYSIDAGWWLSEDPIGFDGNDPNLRRYVGNHIVGATDPLGLKPPQTVMGGIGQSLHNNAMTLSPVYGTGAAAFGYGPAGCGFEGVWNYYLLTYTAPGVGLGTVDGYGEAWNTPIVTPYGASNSLSVVWHHFSNYSLISPNLQGGAGVVAIYNGQYGSGAQSLTDATIHAGAIAGPAAAGGVLSKPSGPPAVKPTTTSAPKSGNLVPPSGNALEQLAQKAQASGTVAEQVAAGGTVAEQPAGRPLSPSNYPNPDPPMSTAPVRYEPVLDAEVIRMRQGKGPTTKATHGTSNIEAHHRQQTSVEQGGVIDELEMGTHRGQGNHSRHSQPSQLTPAQRAREIRQHWQRRGAEYILPGGEGI